MAQGDNSDIQQEMAKEEEQQRLKYLEFVQVAAIHAALSFTSLYLYAKERSGPLKPGVETVEGTVKNVVRPVYDKYRDVPVELLKFVDAKVDESVTKLDSRVPPVIRQMSTKAVSAAQKAPAVASDVHRDGVVNTASEYAKSVYTKYEPTAKELYAKYEPKAEQCAVSTWRTLNKLPLFPRVASVVVPTAAYCTDKYNQTVVIGAEKGYKVVSYLPLVPTEKIAKVFGEQKPETEPLEPVASAS
ncbi:Stress-related protein [Hibiscus syriacus]|uniref:Stress-related protein n=1 Tax=Hibiscus syriacus TaxID=106335 RepID=A0A6A2YXP0_HIBSY|nr:REF/SRPP-like protein At3g05500 [Hibiscus syriacus]KAE8684099.1 Stress-related protein [Hibiscus syriacus]